MGYSINIKNQDTDKAKKIKEESQAIISSGDPFILISVNGSDKTGDGKAMFYCDTDGCAPASLIAILKMMTNLRQELITAVSVENDLDVKKVMALLDRLDSDCCGKCDQS